MDVRREEQCLHARQIIQFLQTAPPQTDLSKLGCAYSLLVRYVIGSYNDEIAKDVEKLLAVKFRNYSSRLESLLGQNILFLKSFVDESKRASTFESNATGREYLLQVKQIRHPDESFESRKKPVPIAISELPKLYLLYYGRCLEIETELDLLLHIIKMFMTTSLASGKFEYVLSVIRLCVAGRMPIITLLDGDPSQNLKLLQNWCSLVQVALSGAYFCFEKIATTGQIDHGNELIEFGLEHCAQLLSVHSTLNAVAATEYCRELPVALTVIKKTLMTAIYRGILCVFTVAKQHHPTELPTEYILRQRIHDIVKLLLPVLDVSQIFQLIHDVLKFVSPSIKNDEHLQESCANKFLFDFFVHCSTVLRQDSDNWSNFLDVCFHQMPFGFCSCINGRRLFDSLYLPTIDENLLLIFKKIIVKHFRCKKSNNANKKGKNGISFIEIRRWLDESDCNESDVIDVMAELYHAMNNEEQCQTVHILIDFFNGDNAEIAAKLAIIKFCLERVDEPPVLAEISTTIVTPNMSTHFMVDDIGAPFRLLINHCIMRSNSEEAVTDLLNCCLSAFKILFNSAINDVISFVSRENLLHFHEIMALMDILYTPLRSNFLNDKIDKEYFESCQNLTTICLNALIEQLHADNSVNLRLSQLLALAVKTVAIDSGQFSRIKQSFESMNFKMEHFQSTITVSNGLLREAAQWHFLVNEPRASTSSAADSDNEGITGNEFSENFQPKNELSGCSIDEEVALIAVKLATFAILKTDVISDFDEVKLRDFLALLRPEFYAVDRSILEQITNLLFECLDHFSKMTTQPSDGIVTKFVIKAGEFVAQRPQPPMLAKFLPGAYQGSKAMADTAMALETILLRRPLEPMITLQMPQRPFLASEKPDPQLIPSKLEPTAAASFTLDPIHHIFINDGITISFWLAIDKLEDAQKTAKKQIHIASIGTPTINAQLFAATTTGTLTIRFNVNGTMLQNVTKRRLFDGSKGRWQFICFGFKANERKLVSSYVLGHHVESIDIDLPPLPPSAIQSTFELCLGATVMDTVASEPFAYSMSTLFAFKSVLTRECIIAARALGCETQCLTECRAGELYTSFASLMTRAFITGKTCPLLEVWSDPKKYVARLQRSALLVVQTGSAHCYGLSVLQKGLDSEILANLGESVLCLTMYKEFPIQWHSPIECRKVVTLDTGLRAIGSGKLFVFLYALSVDKGYSSAAQLCTLRLLFAALRRSPTFYGEFREAHGIHVLTQVLNTTTAYIDDDIFNELAKFIFSELEPEADRSDVLGVSFYTVILEPELLKTLISTTDLWKGKAFKYCERLIYLCASCLDNCKAMFCDFNSQILANVGFLTPFLYSLLDMQQHPQLFSAKSFAHYFNQFAEHDNPLVLASKSIVSSICVIVSELVPSPFRSPAVTSLWKYILLSHPAESTYLDYSFKGHTEWIKPEEIDAPIVAEPALETTTSLLSSFFEKVLMSFDKDKIAEVWRQGNNVTMVREMILRTDADYRIFAPGPPTPMRMDSITCGHTHVYPESPSRLMHSNAASNEHHVDHWLTTLRTSMLSMFCNIVLSCEDSLMAVLQLDVIYWKTILVQLTNQSHPYMRNQIFVLLQNYFLRCDERHRIEFVTQHGFLLLASQLRKFPVTLTVADALFSLFCGECVKVKDGLDEEHVELIEVTPFRYASFHALFALLEASAVDQALFWTVCSTLQKIFEANVRLRKAMVECGIADTLMNVLRLLCIQQQSVKRMIGPVFPLIDCWISFARSVITNVIPYRDSYMYAASKDFLLLCAVADYRLNSPVIKATPMERLRKFSESLSVPPPIKPVACSECARKMVRQILCQLLEAWIDSLMAVVVDTGNTMIPVDERLDGDDAASDSSFEVCYTDSEFTSSSFALYGGHGDRTTRKKRFEFATVDELTTRLCFGLQMVNDLFVCSQIPELIGETEEGLFHVYLGILLAPWKKRNTETIDDYQKLLAGYKEQARVQLAKLIAYVLFPAQLRQRQLFGSHINLDHAGLLRRRLHIVRSLADMLSKDRDCISTLLEVDLDYQYASKIALHELALCPQYAEVWSEYGDDLERLIRFLRTMQLESPLANLTRDEVNSLTTDEVILLHTYSEKMGIYTRTLQNEALRLCEKSRSLTKAVVDTAMTLTCSIAELQNEPRKLYIKCRKDAINACARANEVLANLVVELCHPFAPFYDASSWPKGWMLDSTENLHRERKRLKPEHYRFDLKFLKPQKRAEVEDTVDCVPPLQKLREACPNFATTDYIEASNHVRLSLSATVIRSVYECSGEVVITDRKIHFLGEVARSTQKGAACQPVTFAWSYEQLSEVYYRYYLLKDTALELFTTTGDAFLIVFATTIDRNSFVDQLKRMDLADLMAEEEKQLKLATQLWRRGSMTNFDYLMTINKLAGRSFNDLMQYPVFPFVLSNYTTSPLNLNLVTTFRDLSRPMAIQNRSMEEVYVKNYESLAEESLRHQEEFDSFSSACFGAYHYGSHYSNTGIVAYYLVRVLPFTNVALEYQDNNFDIPDRLFNSIDTTWRLSSLESTTDFKELTPEFFFLPEMFANREQLNLGIRQAGIAVDDVILPPWCPENNFRLFVLIHRQALESAIVTANLHAWIDLIFGFKQQGQAAISAINVFHPATYRGRDFETQQSHDEISISALRTMVRTYGQMPTQLFLSPHLPHLNLSRPSFDAVLSPTSTDNPLNFFPSVKGLRWGEFVGSPDLDRRLWLQPVLNLNLSSGHESIGRLVPINKEGFCYALPEKTELVNRIIVDAKDPLRRTFETATTAVVSWRFSDNILRLKLVQMDDSVWVNLIDLQVFEPTLVVYSPNAELLYVGTSCGLIRVYSIDFRVDSKTWNVKLVSELFAHRSAISTLKVCDDFHLVLSTSVDGHACTWDSNQLTYIRSFEPKSCGITETITLTAISSISADIAIVYQSGRGSRLVLYTVNGDIIGTYASGPDMTISSVAMTNMDEGTGINCLAIGMQNGVIRILESWTLSLVTDISIGMNIPVTSVEFTNEARRMYVALATGRVFCWQGATAASFNATPSKSRTKNDASVKFLNPYC